MNQPSGFVSDGDGLYAVCAMRFGTFLRRLGVRSSRRYRARRDWKAKTGSGMVPWLVNDVREDRKLLAPAGEFPLPKLRGPVEVSALRLFCIMGDNKT